MTARKVATPRTSGGTPTAFEVDTLRDAYTRGREERADVSYALGMKRAAEIADSHASIEGIAQKIADEIRKEIDSP